MASADAYESDGTPNYCGECGSKAMTLTVKDTIAHVDCEIQYECADCGEPLAYWAYGSFDPGYYLKGSSV